MAILVTGGAGYIGSVTVEALEAEGFDVVVVDNLSRGYREAVADHTPFYLGNIGDRGLIQRILNAHPITACMHFSAFAYVGESVEKPQMYFENNFVQTAALLDELIAGGVMRFVFSSTCATYGVPDRMPMDESLPQRPINPYGESKLMFERILDWYDRIHGLRHVNLRYFNAAGASEKYGEHHCIETHLIPNILKVALGQDPHVEVYGTGHPTPDGTCIRDFIHIIDLAQAHELALDAKASASYNIGTGAGYSVKQIIDVARQVTGHPIPIVERPARPGDPPRLMASADKLRRELGWRPKFESIEAIVASAWHWHQAHPAGYQD